MADTNSVAELEAPDSTVTLDSPDDVENTDVVGDDDSDDKSLETDSDKSDKPDDEPETLDEAKYWDALRKEHQIPEDVKDFGSFVAQHKAMLAEMQRKPKPVETKPKDDEPKPFFKENLGAATYQEWLTKRGFADDGTKQHWASVAEFIDSSVGGELKQHANVLLSIAPMLKRVTERLQSLEWNGLDEGFRKNFKLDEIREVMQDHNFDDFESAIRHTIFEKRPDLIELLHKRVKEDGAREERTKQRFVQRTAPRGGGTQPEKTGFWKQFVDRHGEVNRGRLMKLDPKERTRILDILSKNGY